eukprot:CAMPEP_0197897094 /NCGR_PEP_ID=MMETSP1439-20131203/41638_1 /TAXON_ID=66791 /ORGANISM="Gonyaulax spinifera, Strain CCMP409" /LENGTH=226 /DNA_ID=CAMNT_0043517701 /DNA_START=48 /DNA_END=728 /DNA_ORIENTATION=-
MTLRSVVLAAAAPLLAAAAPSGMATHCHNFLNRMSTEGHSRFEVGALCRARLPPDVCQRVLKPLGEQPWSPETLDTTCNGWEAEYQSRLEALAPSRRAQTVVGVVKMLDQVTAMKAELGICKHMSLEECAAHKAKEYPKATQKLMKLMRRLYDSYTGNGPAVLPDPDSDRPSRLYQDAAPVEAGVLPGRSLGIFAASGALGGAAVAAAVLARRRQRSPPSASALPE